MKKIVLIIAVTTIPLVTIIGGLYVFGELKMNKTIVEAVENMEKPYYKGIASVCFKKDKSEYQCCLSSVYEMIESGARLADSKECANMATNQLRCSGSYKWCVPVSKSVDLNISEYEGKYQALEEKCINKALDDGQEDCLETVSIMRENNYEPTPCTEKNYTNGFVVEGLNCIGCEDINWCESKDNKNEINDNKACIVDEDCVPATCCHATDVVNKEFAPSCEGMMCTMSCETVLDCGQGEPICNDGMCDINILRESDRIIY